MSYLANRGIDCGLLMPADEAVDAEALNSFKQQLGAKLDDGLTLGADAVGAFPEPDRLLELCRARGVPPASVLLLTTQADTLRAARNAGCFCALFLPRNARRPNARADFTVSSLLKLQGVVEDLNGISWRRAPGRQSE